MTKKQRRSFIEARYHDQNEACSHLASIRDELEPLTKENHRLWLDGKSTTPRSKELDKKIKKLVARMRIWDDKRYRAEKTIEIYRDYQT